MIGDHHDASTLVKNIHCLDQSFLKRFELVVNLDAKRLKDPGERLVQEPFPDALLHECCQISRCCDAVMIPSPDDGPCDPTGSTLFTVFPVHLSRFPLPVPVHNL